MRFVDIINTCNDAHMKEKHDMTILIHRNVAIAPLLACYNAELEPHDHYDTASMLCINFIGEAHDDWPVECDITNVCYVGHHEHTPGIADVFMRIAPSYPAWDIPAYLLANPACEILTTPLPVGMILTMLGSDGR